MADQEWIKHLATSHYEKGQWLAADPKAVRELAAARIATTISALQDEAREATELFNLHAAGRRAMRVLPLAHGPEDKTSGFMLLMGTAQLTLSYSPHYLEAILTTLSGFQKISRRLYRLQPQVDRFGSLAWSLDNGLLMTNELIIKRLMEDMAKAALGLNNP